MQAKSLDPHPSHVNDPYPFVHYTTYKYRMDPDFRQRSLEYHSNYLKTKYENDPEYYEKRKELSRKLMKDRYHNDPEYREKCIARARERYRRLKDKPPCIQPVQSVS